RQCADRARSRALRAQEGGGAGLQGPVRRRDLHGPAPPARAFLRLPAPARPGADALSGRVLAASLGGSRALPAVAGVPRPDLRPAPGRDFPAPALSAAIP